MSETHKNKNMIKQDDRLTLEEAYCAMFFFLEKWYEMTGSDDIGGLLGSLDWTIWSDAFPIDPAVWGDWLNAVKKMKNSSLIQIKENTES